MNTDSKNIGIKNTEPKKVQLMKTLLFIVDDKGGVGKSAGTAHLTDVLLELGYSVRVADADPINRTLSQLIPTEGGTPEVTRLDGNKSTEMINYILETATSDEDVTIIDMPGSSSKLLEKAKISLDAFEKSGVRVVIVIAVTENTDAVLGAREWLRTYGNRLDYFIIASEKECADGEHFNPDRIPGLKPIIQKTGGRLAIIPKFSDILLGHYKTQKSSPKGYFSGGWAAKKMDLNIFYSGLWQTHFEESLASIAPHAEYLTGRPIPRPVQIHTITEKDKSMDDLCSELDALMP